MGFLLPFCVLPTGFFLLQATHDLQYVSYKLLGDIEKLGWTIWPGPFLTHVCMALMPLTNSIKDLLP
jgi:hypothetical protein